MRIKCDEYWLKERLKCMTAFMSHQDPGQWVGEGHFNFLLYLQLSGFFPNAYTFVIQKSKEMKAAYISVTNLF